MLSKSESKMIVQMLAESNMGERCAYHFNNMMNADPRSSDHHVHANAFATAMAKYHEKVNPELANMYHDMATAHMDVADRIDD